MPEGAIKSLVESPVFGRSAQVKRNFSCPSGWSRACRSSRRSRPFKGLAWTPRVLKFAGTSVSIRSRPHFCGPKVVRLNAEGDIFAFGKAVVALLSCPLTYPRILYGSRHIRRRGRGSQCSLRNPAYSPAG